MWRCSARAIHCHLSLTLVLVLAVPCLNYSTLFIAKVVTNEQEDAVAGTILFHFAPN